MKLKLWKTQKKHGKLTQSMYREGLLVLYTGAENEVHVRSRIVQSSDTWQHLALQQLRAGTAPSGDVRHLRRQARLVHRGHGVPATDDADGAVLLCQLGDALRHVVGALAELRALEHAHRTVPDDRLAVRQCSLDLLGRLRAIVQAEPTVRDLLRGHYLEAYVLAARGELVAASHVAREDKLDALGLGLLLQ